MKTNKNEHLGNIELSGFEANILLEAIDSLRHRIQPDEELHNPEVYGVMIDFERALRILLDKPEPDIEDDDEDDGF